MIADVSPGKSHQPTIIEILKQKKRTVSAEIIPPRNGSEAETVLRQIDRLKTVPTDFISVTKGAGGSLRGGTLPIAQLIKSRFDLCSLAHFTCRDYTVEEIENALMDHHYFGIHNILALRGDPPDGQPDHFKAAPNRHSYAYQLVEQIRDLNEGRYLFRPGFDKGEGPKRIGTALNFCIGVAAHPEHAPHEDGVAQFARKVEAGAHFAITQMIFSADPYEKFIESCAARGIHVPVLPGVRIVSQAATAERMKNKFGVGVPSSLIDHLKEAKTKEEGKAIGLEFTHALCEKLLKAGAPGIHIFVMNDENAACQLLNAMK